MINTVTKFRKNRESRRIPLIFVQPICLQNLEVQERPLYDQIVQAQRDSPEYRSIRECWERLQTGQERIQHNWQRTIRDQYTVQDNLIWYTVSGRRALVVPFKFLATSNTRIPRLTSSRTPRTRRNNYYYISTLLLASNETPNKYSRSALPYLCCY